jgi:hypothetical protein
MKNLSRYLAVLAMSLFAISGFAQQIMESDQLPANSLIGSAGKSTHESAHVHANGMAHARKGIPNIDSLVNWSDQYRADGVDQNNQPVSRWFTNTIGDPPNHHGTTVINAPIVPIIMDLRNADGTPRFVNGQPLVSSAEPFVQKVLESPVFSTYNYSSSPVPTQFTDAVQRAEYFSKAKPDWHTILAPSVKTPRTMVLKRGTYQFALNPDGTCCAFILVNRSTFVNALFPATATDTSTPIGAAENAGEVTTKDLSSFLFPNVFLFDSAGCCVLGFHSYDVEPSTEKHIIEQRYVVDYSSWISPGIFGDAFTDVTALSHEIAESYNDPFVASDGIHNVTPWWLSPNGNCQNNLEDGDVVEGLGNATFPITMPNGFTYHPQNEALLQYFTREIPSSAIDGAFSYPNQSVLSGPSAPQHAGCK